MPPQVRGSRKCSGPWAVRGGFQCQPSPFWLHACGWVTCPPWASDSSSGLAKGVPLHFVHPGKVLDMTKVAFINLQRLNFHLGNGIIQIILSLSPTPSCLRPRRTKKPGWKAPPLNTLVQMRKRAVRASLKEGRCCLHPHQDDGDMWLPKTLPGWTFCDSKTVEPPLLRGHSGTKISSLLEFSSNNYLNYPNFWYLNKTGHLPGPSQRQAAAKETQIRLFTVLERNVGPYRRILKMQLKGSYIT